MYIFFSFSIIWIIVVSAVVAECATMTTVKESGGEEGARRRRRERQTDSCLPSTPPDRHIPYREFYIGHRPWPITSLLHTQTHVHINVHKETAKRKQNGNLYILYCMYRLRKQVEVVGEVCIAGMCNIRSYGWYHVLPKLYKYIIEMLW